MQIVLHKKYTKHKFKCAFHNCALNTEFKNTFKTMLKSTDTSLEPLQMTVSVPPVSCYFVL